MDDSKYRYTLYIIVVVIVATIGLQGYWNYKNYLSSKQQLINDVQVSLDKAVDDYYAILAENSTIGFSINGMNQRDFIGKGMFDSIISRLNYSDTDGFGSLDSIDPKLMKGISVVKSPKADSIIKQMQLNAKVEFDNDSTIKLKKIRIDSLSHRPIIGESSSSEKELQTLTSKIIISMSTDSLSLKGIDTLLRSELLRKDINLKYTIKYKDPTNDIDYYNTTQQDFERIDYTTYGKYLSTASKSTFLPKKSELSILFNNISKDVFKRIIWGIVISIILVLAVISCLFYLLNVIKNQKQLADVKNDLISNITHEFKTPIATIGVALESIQNFNVIEDQKKTKTYLDMSREQLSKLNTMVEKLLETATLDSEHLELNFDHYNISEVISAIAEKHQLQHPEKQLTNSIEKIVMAKVDLFHFENAINNVVDNAFKYGGQEIKLDLNQTEDTIEILIGDNGTGLTKVNKDKIFEKFYRVPKGNTHDVKGFGIGLYYTKKIIEKHQGSIELNLTNKQTQFKIQLSNA
ncbi:MAG: HAMP domain-containing sensor histidine kinase [Psychroserpens sp.]|uniref:sensor histidine kinase n=1 Tax=Psychroserpens sp. TaxID=2020870 RepID=UPI003CBF1BA2